MCGIPYSVGMNTEQSKSEQGAARPTVQCPKCLHYYRADENGLVPVHARYPDMGAGSRKCYRLPHKPLTTPNP